MCEQTSQGKGCLRFCVSNCYLVGWDVVETMDVEGCRLVRGDNDF